MRMNQWKGVLRFLRVAYRLTANDLFKIDNLTNSDMQVICPRAFVEVAKMNQRRNFEYPMNSEVVEIRNMEL